jgi:hypothetical protein
LPTSNTDRPDCFVPPASSLVHTLSVFIKDHGTSAGEVAYLTGAGAYNGALAAAASALDTFAQVASDVGTTAGGINGLAHSAQPQYQSTNFEITDKLYGGHNQTVDGENLQDLLQGNPSQGGAVLLAVLPILPDPPAKDEPTQTQSAIVPTVPIGPAPGVSPGGGGATPVSVSEPADTADTSATITTATSTATSTATTIPPAVPIDSAYVAAHWPLTGFYCDGDTDVLLPGLATTYHPSSTFCNYLGGFSDPFWILRVYVLKGVIGSSTVVAEVGSNGPGKIYTDHNYDFFAASAGDTYTVVLTEYSTNIGAQYNVNRLPDFRSYITTGVDTNGNAHAPDFALVTIPFTYAP